MGGGAKLLGLNFNLSTTFKYMLHLRSSTHLFRVTIARYTRVNAVRAHGH